VTEVAVTDVAEVTEVAGPESLAAIVDAVLANPGLATKAEIGLVGDVLGADSTGGTDCWLGGPATTAPCSTPQAPGWWPCGEAIFPPFVAADPHGAGFAAVLTNVNDLAAIGAEPLGIVDTVVASGALAREVLAGRSSVSRRTVPTPAGLPLTRWLNCRASASCCACPRAARTSACRRSPRATWPPRWWGSWTRRASSPSAERVVALKLPDCRVTGLPRAPGKPRSGTIRI
jgi:AIR synthase related protein, N-terminal domain